MKRRARVLLADDAQYILDRVGTILSKNFDVVGTARNGQQAVQLAMFLRPDIVVLDISMPRLNGLEVAFQLHQFCSNLKVVFLTCHEEPEYIEEALSSGALGYVLKYRIAEDLIPAISAALEGHKFVQAAILG